MLKQRDFTLDIYSQLLRALQKSGYLFFTFEQYCSGKVNEKYILLRHDVDLRAPNSLSIAKVEHELGIRSTYYFRVVPESNQPEIIQQIAALGHEIGYHYEDLSICKGDIKAAVLHFEQQLNYFRQFYPIQTICMHGSPTSQYDNKDLWKDYDYHTYGIIGEPYFDIFGSGEEGVQDVFYLTDTGRMWNGDRFSIRDKVAVNQLLDYQSTYELIDAAKSNKLPQKMMITTHPQRWSAHYLEWLYEFLMQGIKNLVKWMVVKIKH
ncbi:MAG: hypothetical protein PHD30_03835 [Paludibacter sp.]|nr:hypothetical protein [Paludibacter sp.]